MYHTRKVRRKYNSLNKRSAERAECDFCHPHTKTTGIIEENDFAYVTENRVPYSLWERRRVTHHLMVIPKKHVAHLSNLPATERHAIMDLIAKYEEHGYDVYLRSPVNPTRSVTHQHTHLIKTEKKLSNFIFFIARPYLLIHR